MIYYGTHCFATYLHSLGESEEQNQACSFNLGNAWAKRKIKKETKLRRPNWFSRKEANTEEKIQHKMLRWLKQEAFDRFWLHGVETTVFFLFISCED